MADLDIIVPVYNAEKYLNECIASIVNQNFNNLSIILVDDGSTDSSGKICDYWAQMDNRVNVIHKNNGGLMSAWKCGVENAFSDYIGFVDSDDWISSEMYEKLMSVAKSENADMVSSSMVKEYEDNNKSIYIKYYIPSGVYDNEQIINEIYPHLISGDNYKNRGISPNRVTKVFRRTLLIESMDYCDDKVTIGEDLLTTFSFIQKCKKVVILNDFFPYHYRIRNGSMIARYSDNKYEKMNILRKYMLKANEIEGHNFDTQINTDYIKLNLMQLDDEILLSGKQYYKLRRSIKRLYQSQSFQEAMENAEVEKMPIKYRLYMFLLRYRLYELVILMRKVKR